MPFALINVPSPFSCLWWKQRKFKARWSLAPAPTLAGTWGHWDSPPKVQASTIIEVDPGHVDSQTSLGFQLLLPSSGHHQELRSEDWGSPGPKKLAVLERAGGSPGSDKTKDEEPIFSCSLFLASPFPCQSVLIWHRFSPGLCCPHMGARFHSKGQNPTPSLPCHHALEMSCIHPTKECTDSELHPAPEPTCSPTPESCWQKPLCQAFLCCAWEMGLYP